MTKATPVGDRVARVLEHGAGERATGASDGEPATTTSDGDDLGRARGGSAAASRVVDDVGVAAAGAPPGPADAAAVSVSVVGGPSPRARRQRRVAERASEPGPAVTEATEAADAIGTGEQGATGVTDALESAPRRARRSAGFGRGPTQRSARRSTMVILSVSTALCAVAAVGFGLAWASLQSQQDTQTQVRAVARQFVLDLTNLTPKTVDAQINDLLAASTGQFASQARSFFGGGIRQELEKAQPVEEGQVRALYVQSITGSRATVFAVVDDSYTNSALRASGQGRQTDVLRLDLGMVDASRGWKIASVTVLGGPAGGVLGTPSAAHSASVGPTGSSGSSS